ncbi:hypothetical protein Zmor_023396 [Zophobas morio]|uniref:Uncharacterized protein n=1 Tax=Zophobas morio TaxID=2755281 RepID=A0AA38HWT2_9CUCU|nr:hypothetical protein Zmor_023396 [Zophobas morio]
MKPPIPIPVLKDLRCGHCRKFVTCGPVHVTPDSSILCGRCARFAKRSYRNIAFEALASLFRYPCYYWPKHCNKKLVWNESLDHERKCLFQSSCNVFCSKPGTFFKSDRKLPNNPEINLEHVTEEIIQDLKCVACESYLSNGPVYIVVDGKNICHRCSHANGVPKGAIRNLAYETIARAAIFPCVYRFRGCNVRLKFGREMWGHENECPYGQTQNRLSKKPSKTSKDTKDGKERGVIETHSGHIWGTITPHSALFAPPKAAKTDGKMVTQELAEMMKKKQQEELKGFDVQSMDSVVSKASTFDSIGDNISRSIGDNISRDNISRSTIDNVSRDNISRTTFDNVSRENFSRSSSRITDEYRRQPNETILDDNYRPSVSGYPPEQAGPSNYDMQRQSKVVRSSEDLNTAYPGFPQEIAPLPTPPGYNKVPFNGYYQDNMARYGRPSHFEQLPQMYNYPPGYYDNNGNMNYSASFSYAPTHHPQIAPKRSESFRVGNQELIDELKERNRNKNSSPSPGVKNDNPYEKCSNLQDLVQKQDEFK